MTVAVGLIADDGSVYIGADSAGTTRSTLEVRRDPKVFRVGALLIAFCGSYRAGQVIRTQLQVAGRSTAIAPDAYLVRQVMPALQRLMDDTGCHAQVVEAVNAGSNGWLLIALEGRLFKVDADYQVAEPRQRFSAVGGGGRVALGALHATPELAGAPRVRVRRALEAAGECCPDVRRPFVVRRLVPRVPRVDHASRRRARMLTAGRMLGGAPLDSPGRARHP